MKATSYLQINVGQPHERHWLNMKMYFVLATCVVFKLVRILDWFWTCLMPASGITGSCGICILVVEPTNYRLIFCTVRFFSSDSHIQTETTNSIFLGKSVCLIKYYSEIKSDKQVACDHCVSLLWLMWVRSDGIPQDSSFLLTATYFCSCNFNISMDSSCLPSPSRFLNLQGLMNE